MEFHPHFVPFREKIIGRTLTCAASPVFSAGLGHPGLSLLESSLAGELESGRPSNRPGGRRSGRGLVRLPLM